MVHPRYTCCLGIIPFMWIPHIFAKIVCVNGVLYHGLFPDNQIIRYWDIACNYVMIIACNVMFMDMVVTALSIVACIVFIRNIKHNDDILHIVGVQWTLACSLIHATV